MDKISERQAKAIYDGRKYHIMPYAFYHITNSNEAADALAYLVNRDGIKEREGDKDYTKNNGWFKLPAPTLRKYFNISHRVQVRVMEELKVLGLVQIEARGKPKKGRCRWIKVMSVKIHQSVVRWEENEEGKNAKKYDHHSNDKPIVKVPKRYHGEGTETIPPVLKNPLLKNL